MWPHRWQPTRLPCPWDSPGKNTRVGFHFLLQCMKVKSESEVAQWCPTLHDPMDCSLPGSSIHRIFQARVLEWGAIAFSNILPELILITSLPLFYLLLPHRIWFPVLLQVFSQLLPHHWNLSRLLSLKLLSLYSQLSKPHLPWFIFFFFFFTYQFLKYFLIGFLPPRLLAPRHLMMYPSDLEHCLASLMCSHTHTQKKHLLNKWMKKS